MHALLGLLQFDLPLARQLHAALEFVERLFQREIAALKTGNDLLQFTQRSFETGRCVVLLRQSELTLIFSAPTW